MGVAFPFPATEFAAPANGVAGRFRSALWVSFPPSPPRPEKTAPSAQE